MSETAKTTYAFEGEYGALVITFGSDLKPLVDAAHSFERIKARIARSSAWGAKSMSACSFSSVAEFMAERPDWMQVVTGESWSITRATVLTAMLEWLADPKTRLYDLNYLLTTLDKFTVKGMDDDALEIVVSAGERIAAANNLTADMAAGMAARFIPCLTDMAEPFQSRMLACADRFSRHYDSRSAICAAKYMLPSLLALPSPELQARALQIAETLTTFERDDTREAAVQALRTALPLMANDKNAATAQRLIDDAENDPTPINVRHDRFIEKFNAIHWPEI